MRHNPLPLPVSCHHLRVLALVGSLAIFVIGLSVHTLANAQTSIFDFSVRVEQGSQSGITIDFIAVPEKRNPTVGNDSTIIVIEVRNPGQTTPIFSGSAVTTSFGTFSGMVLTGVTAGTYDITAKGFSHLRRKKSSVALSSGSTVDFSDSGTNKVFCGDVNTGSTIPNGDNRVNGIDLTVLSNGLLTASVKRDLNLDGLVNGIDLTCAIANLYPTVQGDD